MNEEEIFAFAAALPAEERAAYLASACAGDEAVLARTEQLLRSHDDATFMERSMAGPKSPELEAQLARLKPEEGGERIGNYKLLEKIGEGGFGTVWVADQEKPVRRRVALKIIKLGMDTRDVIARFEQERQALAMMDHPHIAKVFEAGATEWGRPFFVMELVRGIKITDYCDQANLPTAARLQLFIAVCEAVQHAHQKGIIHRDLKPSNILVTLHDGIPVPKVIDFGVAKATQQQRLTDLTVYTQFEQMIGTPLYMSPEQAEMSGLDIDTRSDIYSLGVLLYELLTGRTPFDPEELMRKGLDEIRRSIREQEPKKPSTFLSTMALDRRTNVAQRRQLEGAKLVGLIRGDLDWIAMKALEKDRTRRYATAQDFARDIRRFLDDKPVSAAAPSATYRFSKFARRNKTVLAVVSTIAAVLVAATAVSVWQAHRARKAEAMATARLIEVAAERDAKDQARQEAEGISTFFREVFSSPDPARDGYSITVAETLRRAAEKLGTELRDQPARRTKMLATLGRTYYSLGLPSEAIPLLEQALEFSQSTLRPADRETLGLRHWLSICYADAGRPVREVLEMREETLRLAKMAFGLESLEAGLAMGNLAICYSQEGRDAEVLQMREKIVALYLKLSGPESAYTLLAMSNLAFSYSRAGRDDEALALREQVLMLRRKVLGPEHPDTLWAVQNLAEVYYDLGRCDEALKLREGALASRVKVNGPEHPHTFAAMRELAVSLQQIGRLDEALAIREKNVTMSRKIGGSSPRQEIWALEGLALFYSDAGRWSDLVTVLSELCKLRPEDTIFPVRLATLHAWLGQDSDHLAVSQQQMGRVAGTGDALAAERAAKAYCLRPSSDPALLAQALTLARRAVELGKGDASLRHFRLALGMAEYRSGNFEAADRELTAADEIPTGGPPVLCVSGAFHAMSLFRQGKNVEARKWLAAAEMHMNPSPAGGLIQEGTSTLEMLERWVAYREARALLESEVKP